jgi:uncharacterized membrane protein YjjB (DUF3815 family)
MVSFIVVNMICSFMGTIAFSVLFNVPRRFYVWCGLTGMCGWLCYCVVLNRTSVTMASFLGTFLVVLMSRALAVWQKCPITVFLVAGIFPLIPGAGIYYTVYNVVQGNLAEAAVRGIGAVKVAFAIVLGIVFVVSIPKRWFKANYWRNKLRGDSENSAL